MKNRKEKQTINDGHYIELMDRLYVQISMIEDFLVNHPLTDALKKVRKLVDKAGMSLAEAYQIVGQESYLNDERKNAIKKVIFRRHKNTQN